MACGKLYFKENDDWSKIEKQVLDNSLFGFLEVDIEVPKDKWNYFSEMCPIFVNKEYDETLCGDYTLNLLKSLERKPTKSRKLVVTLKAKQILIKSTRLRWMLEHGCVVTKLYGYIEAKRRRIFKGFMDWVSDERRKGDVDSKYAIISEGAKLVGNSAFGRTGMDKNKHKKVSFCNEVQFNRAKNDYFYYDAEEYNGVYEVTKRTRKVKQNMPLQIACSVYDDSKLRMLKFYYDCIDKYVDRSDFQYIEMDTDSAYMAITDNTLEDLIKPEMKEEFERDKCNWFPRTDTEEHRRIDKRTPGLFKVEKEGDGMIALCSKTYCIWTNDDKCKVSSKGVQQKRNNSILTKEKYLECLVNKQTIDGLNKGFRYQNQEMKTYEQKKIGLSPVYGKGVVMDDGIHIRPIIFE
ncbi:Protein CBG24020 [Caenorhabditis briggsae]|uniref:Protein CBG24020 n=1 Tax=Caenorhabditis briggsae TaxID=6238 RepID=A8WJT4_CAEBR|nr:Protein CBG24020 [Caenorhabditis briggsae]CAP20727.1 Protein CBG24020 [Caenorhabditis briggsae]